MLNNILLDPLPNKTTRGFWIDTDFRTSIKFELLMQDKKISNKEKIMLALDLYYSNIPNIEEAVEDMLWFYRCGKENKELANSNNSNTNNKKEQIYSYEFDDVYIYSAFLEQYNIDLNSIKHLHWWKFKALFNSLKEDTQISKIMSYRAIDLSTIKDKSSKAHYKKLKNIYKLPDLRTSEEKQSDFGKSFW